MSVLSIGPLGFPFPTPPDPFLFAVFHNDQYPAGSETNMEAPRRGNGADFDWSAPWRMYHGKTVPGFPVHPHRGFETISVVLRGLVDHADSMGAGGRYGEGDMQWMCAGKGVQHQEMFPLVHTAKPNTMHFYQIVIIFRHSPLPPPRRRHRTATAPSPPPPPPLQWLNLEKRAKLCDPAYMMHWAERVESVAGEGGARALVYAGTLGSARGGTPPPSSWAADASHDVGVYVVQLPPGGAYTLPPAAGGAATSRVAYVTLGEGVEADGASTPATATLTLRASEATALRNARSAPAEVLVLQGRPIGEPVAQRGPFVMNTDAELDEASSAFARGEFGGWPWPERVVLFPRDKGRFASRPAPGGGGEVVEEQPPPAMKRDEL